jgi:spermidine/putrescine transport system substrate-binding protein
MDEQTPIHRPTEPRFSRRRLLAGGLVGGLSLTSLAAACGGSKAVPPQVGDASWWGEQKATGEVVFANWPLYIDYRNWLKSHPSLNVFSRDTGITVAYEEVINNNEPFYAKIAPLLRAGRPTGYDLIVLTNGWQLTQLIENHWLVPLDHAMIPNFARYASPLVKNPSYDPGNRYTVAWQSGLTGIAYDRRRITRPITSIKDLWDPAFKNRVGMMSDNTDMGSAGLLYLGIDPVSSSRDDWLRAADVLRLQRNIGVVRRYYDQSYIDALQNGDVWISQAWSGDIYQARASGYSDLEFVVPEEGVMHWTDNLMIPMHAADPVNAMRLMNYYYTPDAAARVADWVNYITPVPDARQVISNVFHDPAVAQSPLVFPGPDIAAKARSYRVFHNTAEYNAWNSTFDPIMDGLVGKA